MLTPPPRSTLFPYTTLFRSFAYQTGSPVKIAHAVQGPIRPALGIAMDMSIQLKSASGAICTLSLSFNNDGPLGDRKSTRLNSSHTVISYAVFCLKKKIM